MNRKRDRTWDKLDELPTAADYIAEGAAPLLIMVMVGALIWFAQDLVYQGEHALQLRWILFWFVIGMVGISRIAIEKTPAYAGLFALGLGGAVAVVLQQFFVMPLAGWFLLGLIWWCTNKLVWDCTLIDDREDTSGEGLLGIAGIDETAGDRPPDDVAVKHIEAGRGPKRRPLVWWQRLFVNQSSQPGRPHPHGLWILYFSLAALPLFGFGQLLLLRFRPGSPGLLLLAVYLVAATGLLLLTSFLGLRRYLRQRRLKMPARIAGTWIGVGALIIVGALALSLVLPRPIAVHSPTASGPALAGRNLDEKFVKNNAESGKESEKGASGGDGKSRSPGPQQGNEPDNRGEKKLNGGRENSAKQSTETRQADSPLPQFSLPTAPAWLRWMVRAVFACVLVYLFIRHWRQIVAAIRELIASIRGLFEPRTRRRNPDTGPRISEASPAAPVRFADLPNPFQSGRAVDPVEAVQQTYEALECWAAEHGTARAPDMTSTEFARRLMSIHPELRDGVHRLARLYAGWLYADRRPLPEELPPLAVLWSRMSGA